MSLRLLSKGWGPRGGDSSGPVPFCNLGLKRKQRRKIIPHKTCRFYDLANQSTKPSPKKERFVVLCARYGCQTRAGRGGSIQDTLPTTELGLVAVTSSDRSAQPDNARAERHGTGQRKEILVEMQPTQFLNRSTTLSDSVFAIDCPHTNFELYSHQRWRCAMRLMKLSLF